MSWFDVADSGLSGAGEVTLLSRDDVRKSLTSLDPVGIVRETLADHDHGLGLLPAEAYLRWENSRGAYTRSIGMPGAVRSAYGMKIINASVSNPARGLERAGGIGLCFDAETARITTIMEAGLLSAVRTAAVSAAGVDVLGYSGAASLAVVGCGAQGRMHAALLTERLPSLRNVTLYDRSPEAARALAAALPGVSVRICPTAREAVSSAGIAVFTTTMDEGYAEPDWATPGALLINVSLGDLTDAAFRDAAAVYVDDVDLVADNPRRPLGRLMAEGVFGRPGSEGPARPLDGTLGGVLTGRHRMPGVASPYVVLNPFGMGVLDVALYAAVSARAREEGLGTVVHLGS
ncbi:ornithine cyclodeaminase family protein [Amycolatopsis orientalis]|uniref:ornithine cyclodeaminase family protein n=1 Tax=Amycolatopsis orientalis TaxID=31958 RepID=UPI000408E754|nr:ornithine cyclodeaminase family protein [Amycolatopsis orientalis]